MRNQLLSFFVLNLLLLVSCQEAAKTETAAAPDYAAFDKKVEAIRSFYKAHSAEDLATLENIFADSVKWSPPVYNENKWLGKTELMAALKAYHENYEDINYSEGLVRPDSTAGSYYGGSVFPKETASNRPTNIRSYGTWTGIESKSKQRVGIKYYSNIVVNDDGKIVVYSDYFDTNSLIPK
jgi:ketosteroid isomerase-like protein